MAVGEQVQDVAELLSFAELPDGSGIKVIDRIERRHLKIETGCPVRPEPTSTDAFAFPVDEAVTIETDRLFIPHELCVVVWNSLGFMISEITSDEAETFPRDRYVFELPAPIKIYVTFEESCSVSMSGEGVLIEPADSTVIEIGARSNHKQPAATITTTERVEDLMRSISYFGSGLKTTTCERSYPSHRGHPPTLEIGERFSVPSVLSRPDTGITIEVPEDLSSVFTVASLAYYLGAEVRPGETPRIVSDQGFTYPLSSAGRSFEEQVERTLKQTFFLDCLTRTEGLYQIDLHERNQVGSKIGIDLQDLYGASLATQLEAYLGVSYEIIKPYLPKWQLSAHLTPRPENAETLPFLANDLAVVKVPTNNSTGQSRTRAVGVDEFVRSSSSRKAARSEPEIESAPTPSLVRIEDEDTMEQTWLGDGAPLGASKAIPEAFHNRLGRTPSDEDIDITVVCNAVEMGQESDLVNQVYGSREELPFDVVVHQDLTVQELRGVLEEETDFFHYIGHIDAGGFECTDGRFDAATLDQTGIDVFFLNACSSYEQGEHLIRAGSIGGVVTLQDVINSGAERVGKTLARLLNCGFPLRAAMRLARNESIMGGHYLVIGDGGVDIAQPKGFVPTLCRLREVKDGYHLKWITYLTHEKGMGSISTPFIDECEEYHLVSGESGSFTVSKDELRRFFDLEEGPVLVDNQLTWRSEFFA